MVSWREIYLLLGELLDFASIGDGEAEVPVDETCSLLWNLDFGPECSTWHKFPNPGGAISTKNVIRISYFQSRGHNFD